MLKNITRKLQIFTKKHYICTKFKFNRMEQDLNRLKVVLVERNLLDVDIKDLIQSSK
jgi:hypothetical protein